MHEKVRVLVTGDRNWRGACAMMDVFEKLPDTLFEALNPEWDGMGNSFFLPDEILIVQGEARGADTYADVCAQLMGFQGEGYPANWNEYGRAAGPIRNQAMLDTGIDYWIAFHTDLSNSRGTRDMVDRLQTAGIPGRIIDKEF